MNDQPSGAREMILRPATFSDAMPLADLSRRAFCAAFEHLYDPKDLNAFLAQHKTVEVFADIIADANKQVDLLEEAGVIAAYAIMAFTSPYKEHSDSTRPAMLDQLYTDPARTNERLGPVLMKQVINTAKQRDCDAIQLSVYSENFGAQRFYDRFGFIKIADIEFWVGNHRDDEFLFELKL